MILTKDKTNNAIITKLSNVREHPNANRLKLATVLGTQVIVDLEARDGDAVIYFDSNLRLSQEYLYYNNLYSNQEMNENKAKKGYFGKNGRVKAQKFRGEISNGYVAPFSSLEFIASIAPTEPFNDLRRINSQGVKLQGINLHNADLKNANLRVHEILANIKMDDEFTHINGVKICEKYMADNSTFGGNVKKKDKPKSAMFHKHWDTKQLMRELNSLPTDAVLYVEEKIHGTSGRTGNVLCNNKKWWQIWKEKQVWKVLSGTRRVDDIDAHLSSIRREIDCKVAPNLHKGEEIYYEIYGYEGASTIQKGFPYDCKPHQYKAMLYRVTITTPDGYSIDLNRELVYDRAEELGLEKPTLLRKIYDNSPLISLNDKIEVIANLTKGKSSLDLSTLREGVVVWFRGWDGKWTALKHKSEEFLMFESKQRDKEINDVEDNL